MWLEYALRGFLTHQNLVRLNFDLLVQSPNSAQNYWFKSYPSKPPHDIYNI